MWPLLLMCLPNALWLESEPIPEDDPGVRCAGADLVVEAGVVASVGSVGECPGRDD